MLSVICPVYNEEKYVAACLDSLLAQDYPSADMEWLFVDGGSSDHTLEILSSYAERCPQLKVLHNPKRIVPCAMNIGIAASTGELIARIDAHSLYPPDYLSSLLAWHEKLPEADNVGGCCDTRVLKRTAAALSIAKVMSDRFGVGNSSFRIGSDREYVEADTVPFGCYKRRVFERIGGYNEALVRCQDIELNKRLRHAGGRIFLVPGIRCAYIPRDNYRDFSRNRYLTGYWVVRTCFLTGTVRNLGLRHFVPAVFVCALVLPLLCSLFWRKACLLTLAILLLYLLFMGGRSLQLSDRETPAFGLLTAFALLHLSYGTGSVAALFVSLYQKLRA